MLLILSKIKANLSTRASKQIYKIIRKTGIKKRLIISFLLLAFIPLLFQGVFSYYKSSAAIHNKISTYSIKLGDQLSMILGADIKKLTTSLDEISLSEVFQNRLGKYKYLQNYEKTEITRKIENEITTKLGKEPGYKGTLIVLESGENIPIGQISSKLTNYKESIDNAKLGMGKVSWNLEQNSSNVAYLTMSKQIINYSEGKVYGVIIIEWTDELFNNTIKNTVTDGVSTSVLNSQGRLIVESNNLNVIGTKYMSPELIKKLRDNMNKKINAFEFNNQLITFSYLKDTNWYILNILANSYLNHESYEIRNTTILVVVISLLLIILLSNIIALSIFRPLRRLEMYMRESSQGNLAINITDDGEDEINAVLRSFKLMLESICSLMSKVNNESARLLIDSKKISIFASKTRESSEELSKAVYEMASGASSQSNELEGIVQNTHVLSDGVNMIGSNMNAIESLISNTSNLKSEVTSTVDELNDKAQETSHISGLILENINDLEQNMKQIKNILKIITNISNQTNLLSFNAAVEAAKAGENGRGFALVAEEVRKLADQSKTATADIQEIIASIEQKTNQILEVASSEAQIVNQQVECVKKTEYAFNTFFNIFEQIEVSIEKLNVSLKDMVSFKDVNLRKIEIIASVSEQAAAMSQEVSANAQELMTCGAELAEFAMQLINVSEQLGNNVSIFKYNN